MLERNKTVALCVGLVLGFAIWAFAYTAHAADRTAEYRLYREMGRGEIDSDHGVDCKDRVRGLGAQFVTEAEATRLAEKDWMEHVRYDHGETYADLGNARGYLKRCSRTSIGEVAGQYLSRCEIWARPCRAPLTEAEPRKQ